jgi:signal transduction histidine kinase
MNKEALQNAKIVTTNIKVPLPFWKNQYFLLTAVLSLIAISMFSVRRATRRIMEKKLRESEITEMIYKERERISRDLHDNLGAYAACIKNSIVGIERSSNDSFELQNLRENTDELLNALRETIWALQHESIRITAISDRFKKIVNRISAGYSSVRVEIKENITKDVFLTPTEGVNLIRIMQESITNAMKHARCTVINVHIESSDDLLISISDNGIGFDVQKKADETYGIGNIRTRAEEAGFKLHMNSNGDGSSIQISKRIKN